MSIKLSDSIRVGQQKPLEDKYFNELVPYTSTSQVNTLLPKAVRHIGLTVNINGEEYWYKDGIENENLVPKLTNSNNYDLKNQEQDDRLLGIEGENAYQYYLIDDLNSRLNFEIVKNDDQDSRLENLEGINYVWSPTNRNLTLFDRGGTQLSQVSLVSLDNEGTDLRYNATTLSLDLYNADNELLDSIPVSSFISSVGTQLQLNSNQLQLKDSQGNILSTVGFTISNIQGLQIALDGKLNKGGYVGTAGDLKTLIDSVSQSLQNETSSRVNADLLKQDKLSSYDESILIEEGGNIEGNVSLFEEYFEQQECELNFTPIQIVGVYVNGIKLLKPEYEIILPKKIKIKEYVDENIQIQYTKLKN